MSIKVGEIPQSDLEQCICDFCKCYTNIPPIRLINGKLTCGRCPGSGTELTVLEMLMKNVEFPCRYKKLGCNEVLKWNEGLDHEPECKYRNYKCVVTHCNWTGDFSMYHVHIRKTHRELFIIPRQTINVNFKDIETLSHLYLDGDRVFPVTLSVTQKGIEHSIRAFCLKPKLCCYKYDLLLQQSDVDINIRGQKLCMVEDERQFINDIIEIKRLDTFFSTTKIVKISIIITVNGLVPPPNKFYKIMDSFKCRLCHTKIYPHDEIYENDGPCCGRCCRNVPEDSFLKEMLVKLYSRPLLLHDILTTIKCAYCQKNIHCEENLYIEQNEIGMRCSYCKSRYARSANAYMQLRNRFSGLFNTFN